MIVSTRIRSFNKKKYVYQIHHDLRLSIPNYVDKNRLHKNKYYSLNENIKSKDDVVEFVKNEFEFIKKDFYENNNRRLRSDAGIIIEGIITFSKDSRDFVNDEKNFEKLDKKAIEFVERLANQFNTKALYVVRHSDETTTHYHYAIMNYDYENHRTIRANLKKSDTSKLQDLIAGVFSEIGFSRGIKVAERIKEALRTGEEANIWNWGSVAQIHSKMLKEIEEMKKKESELIQKIEKYERLALKKAKQIEELEKRLEEAKIKAEEEVRKKIEEKIKKAKKTLEVYRQRIIKAKEEEEKLIKAIEEKNQVLSNLENSKQKAIDEKQKVIDNLEKIEREKSQKLKELQLSIDKLDSEIREKSQKLKELQKLEEELKDVDFTLKLPELPKIRGTFSKKIDIDDFYDFLEKVKKEFEELKNKASKFVMKKLEEERKAIEDRIKIELDLKAVKLEKENKRLIEENKFLLDKLKELEELITDLDKIKEENKMLKDELAKFKVDKNVDININKDNNKGFKLDR